MAFQFTVNDSAVSVDAPAATPLLWVIREELKLTGTKFGCGAGVCGACVVHVDGKRTFSCQTQVWSVAGKEVTTIEGLSPDSSHPVQKAWLAERVPQCGYCQSGQIMSAAYLLKQNPHPTRARLSLEAELANDYIAVRGYDVDLEVLRQSILAYRQAVEVARLRSRGKIASGLDLARALSQLDSALAQETETRLQRDLMQHAIAVLVNAMPSSFSIAPVKEFTLMPPQVPAGIPSELLQRRPDIASAERQMAAANAEIGVSRAAFYPNITLSAGAGFEDNAFNLLSLPNSLWSVGAGAMLPLFEGGLRRAELQRAWSQYAQTRDGYRSTVLASFQEVEDGLSLNQRLATEVVQQRESSDQATQALNISTMLYEDGLDNYLSVAVAQVTALAAQTAEVQILTRQMQASVSLIRALGGGWTVQSLPTEKQTLPFGPLDYHAVRY